MRSGIVTPKIKKAISGVCLMSCLLCAPAAAGAEEVFLPRPQIQEGMPVMQALARRQTSRSFAVAEISLSQLSHILWAANGINRAEAGGRTNPAALGVHSVEVYAVTDKGIYLYHPQSHALHLVVEGDFRMATTKGQAFVGEAPLNLVYVGNSSAWENARRVPSEEEQILYDSIAAGSMSQSVALVAAAEGLGTCVRGSIDIETFGETVGLQEGQTILLAQTVGVLQ